MLLIICICCLSGCNTGPGNCEPAVNEDSVRNHVISLKEAIDFTTRFRKTVDTLNTHCPPFKDSFRVGHSEAFNRDSYYLLLKQKDSTGSPAAGIRIYYGLDDKGVMKLVMVPYDKNGNDIIKHLVSVGDKPVPGVSAAKTESLAVDGAQAMETGQLCPPNCPPTSPLEPKP